MRIAILGGGMAGLAAAWALTDPQADSAVESVTVYQRGWRLGGKGASGRGRRRTKGRCCTAEAGTVSQVRR